MIDPGELLRKVMAMLGFGGGPSNQIAALRQAETAVDREKSAARDELRLAIDQTKQSSERISRRQGSIAIRLAEAEMALIDPTKTGRLR